MKRKTHLIDFTITDGEFVGARLTCPYPPGDPLAPCAMHEGETRIPGCAGQNWLAATSAADVIAGTVDVASNSPIEAEVVPTGDGGVQILVGDARERFLADQPVDEMQVAKQRVAQLLVEKLDTMVGYGEFMRWANEAHVVVAFDPTVFDTDHPETVATAISVVGTWPNYIEAREAAEKRAADLNRGIGTEEAPFVVVAVPLHPDD